MRSRQPMSQADSLRGLALAYDLAVIYAFGSRAAEIAHRVAGTGPAVTGRPESDVDIGVLPVRAGTLAPRDRVRLAQALEDLLGVNRVDLVVLPEAPAFLAADIVAGEPLVITAPDVEAEYQLYALRRAGDLLPFEQERLAGWLAGTLEPR